VAAVLGFILKALVEVLASVFIKASTTPAKEEEVDVEEGNAPRPNIDYGSAYGL